MQIATIGKWEKSMEMHCQQSRWPKSAWSTCSTWWDPGDLVGRCFLVEEMGGFWLAGGGGRVETTEKESTEGSIVFFLGV